jgi:tRNA-splicing ligase RtcB
MGQGCGRLVFNGKQRSSIMEVIQVEGARKPIFSWCPVSTLEENARKQMEVIARLPFVEHTALMPDTHLGNSMCIGGVVATNDTLIPNFTGSDGGCGVGAIKTTITKDQIMDVELRKRIYHSVCRGIPMGFSHNTQKRVQELERKYKSKIDYIWEKSKIKDVCDTYQVLKDPEKAFLEQGGSLGSGNHFASMDYDEEGNIWIMVHSGSRNIGKRLCDYFNELAMHKMKQWHSINTFDPTARWNSSFNTSSHTDVIFTNSMKFFWNC